MDAINPKKRRSALIDLEQTLSLENAQFIHFLYNYMA